LSYNHEVALCIELNDDCHLGVSQLKTHGSIPCGRKTRAKVNWSSAARQGHFWSPSMHSRACPSRDSRHLRPSQAHWSPTHRTTRGCSALSLAVRLNTSSSSTQVAHTATLLLNSLSNPGAKSYGTLPVFQDFRTQ